MFNAADIRLALWILFIPLVFLGIAALMRQVPIASSIFCVLAFLGLIFSGGCVILAAGINRAVSGTGSDIESFWTLAWPFVPVCVGCAALAKKMPNERPARKTLVGLWIALIALVVIALALPAIWKSPIRWNHFGAFLMVEGVLIISGYSVASFLLFQNRILALFGLLAFSAASVFCLYLFAGSPG
jgi:hypothetical protein